jgi:hypothetical protein
MSEFKGTPGPWVYSRDNWRNETQSRDWYVTGDHGEGSCVAVAVVSGNETSHPVCEANATLISAAPDLLAALEYIVAWNGTTWNAETARDMARRAIAKATGAAQP